MKGVEGEEEEEEEEEESYDAMNYQRNLFQFFFMIRFDFLLLLLKIIFC